MSNYIVFFLCFFAVMQAGASDKVQNKIKKQSFLTSKSIVKTWSPMPFSQEKESLPANYLGVNPKLFLELFKSKVDGLEKGEFETTDEFTKRLENKERLLAPINTQDLYAFRMDSIDFSYDADKKSYTAQNYSCEKTYSEDSDYRVICDVAEVYNFKDTYIGSNAFGASVTIHSSSTRTFGLSILNTNPVFVSLFSNFEYNYALSVPIERAKYLKENKMKIGMLFIGRINGTRVENFSSGMSPTRDFPFDIHNLTEGVPFDIKQVIYYVIKTGEILEKKVF